MSGALNKVFLSMAILMSQLIFVFYASLVPDETREIGESVE